mmetsp:Transcript_75934/g.220504  ORF Transcript_75934/g.220504 Transcript_75934/m.220504 type:complete len:114 (+) Transcript_75934:734-1075(+)
MSTADVTVSLVAERRDVMDDWSDVVRSMSLPMLLLRRPVERKSVEPTLPLEERREAVVDRSIALNFIVIPSSSTTDFCNAIEAPLCAHVGAQHWKNCIAGCDPTSNDLREGNF